MKSLFKSSKVRAFMASFPLSFGMAFSASAAIQPGTASFVDTSIYTSEMTGIPSFIERATGKPSVILAFDVSGSMLHSAYERRALIRQNNPGDGFNPLRRDLDGSGAIDGISEGYYGYFDPTRQYRYDYDNEYFIADDTLSQGDPDAWDGNFMNWLTMRRVDVARKVMVGGKVLDRDGIDINGTKHWVLEGEIQYRDRDALLMQYAASQDYSPIPNDTQVVISDGLIGIGSVPGSSNGIALSDNFEIGVLRDKEISQTDVDNGYYYDFPGVADDPDTADDESEPAARWDRINYLNSYDDAVLVAVSISNHGSNASIARATAVNNNNARVGLIEWIETPDGHGSNDEIFYMVAERGCHPLTLEDGTERQICAGETNNTNGDPERANRWVNDTTERVSITYPESFSTTPAVFAGVSTMLRPNSVGGSRVDNRDVTGLVARTDNVNSTGFDVQLTGVYQPGGSGTDTSAFQLQGRERIHWIAIEPITRDVTANGIEVEMGTTNVTSSRTNITYTEPFAEVPLVAASPQTFNETNVPFFPRLGISGVDDGGDGLSETSLDITLQAHDDGGVSSENVSYIAAAPLSQIRLRVAVDEEPRGIVQENNAAVNFGLSVYNFNHQANNMDSIISSNRVDGQTMNPCYPVFDDDKLAAYELAAGSDPDMSVEEVTLDNGSTRKYVCVPTSVHAPNEKIVQVIEDYPMIWGTTPIAETVVDIGRYVRQEDPTTAYNQGNMVTSGGTTFYDYGTGPDWDPYYDPEQGQSLECKKVFLLNFNDGAPYTDYDGDGHETDGYYYATDSGGAADGQNEALDNVSLALRKNDCRSADAPGGNVLDNHQEVISYYVFAALDAEPSDDPEDPPAGDPTSLRRMMEAAAMGGFQDGAISTDEINNLPDPISPPNGLNFYEHSQLGAENCDRNEWDNDGDCVPDTFYLAEDGNEIADQLNKALRDILARVSSGGAASVVSNTVSGEGAIYSASFSPSREDGDDVVKWVGDIASTFIDAEGRLRSDTNGNKVLDPFSTNDTGPDQIIDTCFDTGRNIVRVALSDDEESRPEYDRSGSDPEKGCDESNFPFGLTDIEYVWSASDMLGSIEDITQRSYNSTANRRHILTSLQNDTGDLELAAFDTSSFDASNVGLLNAADKGDADAIVKFVRGADPDITGNEDQQNFRNRKINGELLLLGDVINSTPTVVGAPAEALNILYDDLSYRNFLNQYRDRRTVVYAGGNDGMLHAFNAGWFDKITKQFQTDSVDENVNVTEWALGQEIWSYVPYNLLPHLHYLTSTDYGVQDGDHLYFVDQTPYVFDAQIFADSDTHPDGWGTVLVVGFRTGGAEVEVYPDPTDLSETAVMRPAYVILDITDPESPPELLAEFSHPDLGMTFSSPTALTLVSATDSTDVDWFLAFGSGPSADPDGQLEVSADQNARLFMLNLKTMELESSFGSGGVLDLGSVSGINNAEVANSFVGDLAAIDFGFDVNTDVVYFGTVQSKPQDFDPNDSTTDATLDWGGKLFRLNTGRDISTGSPEWDVDMILDIDDPVLFRPQVTIDPNGNRWVYTGTGRFITIDDTLDKDNRFIVGVKDHSESSLDMNDLVDTSDSVVTVISDADNPGGLEGVNTTGFTAGQTVQDFEALMMTTDRNGANYKHGWKRDLERTTLTSGDLAVGQRALGAPTLFGGYLTQSAYTPEGLECSVLGESRLHAVRYTTGTGWYDQIFVLETDPDRSDVVTDVEIGDTAAYSPAIHVGDGTADGIATLRTLSVDNSNTETNQQNLENINSQEIDWREL